MPIYGYECEQCGHTFEVLQSINEAPLRECPNCMGPLHKLLYPVGVIYKGSGFYTTDYKGAGRQQGSKSETKAETGSDGASTSESKAPEKSDKGTSETKSTPD